MGYCIFDKTCSDIYKVRKRAFGQGGINADSATGKEILEDLPNGIYPVNLVPYSFLGDFTSVEKGNFNITKTAQFNFSLSNYFVTDARFFDIAFFDIRCLASLSSGKIVDIFDSNIEDFEYPGNIPTCSFYVGFFIVLVADSSDNPGNPVTINMTIYKDRDKEENFGTLQFKVGNLAFNSFSVVPNNFVPEKTKFYPVLRIFGNIKNRDSFIMSPVIMFGLNPYEDFSCTDIFCCGNTPEVYFSGTLEDYAVWNPDE